MKIRAYEWRTAIYQQELTLRDKVLRKPLGMNLFDEDLSQDKVDTHIGAFDNGILVGVILLSPSDEAIIKMRQVAIDDEYQSRGIGSAMVIFCEKYAIENGYKTMTMHARKTAMPFYIKLGYTVEGDEFTEVSIPHFKMIKNLQ